MNEKYAPEIGEHWCSQKKGKHTVCTPRCEACGMARYANGMLGHTACGSSDSHPHDWIFEDVHHDAHEALTFHKLPEPGGVKYDAEKVRMDLLDPYAMEQLAAVLTFGAKKYAAHNWRKGFLKTRLIAAMLRHIFAYLRGEDKDPESGLSHIAHAMCMGMFILGLEHRTDLDDRYKE